MDGLPDVLGVESLTDHAVMIRTLVRARPGDQWALGREFRRRILRRLEAEGMETPIPRRMVQVRQPGGGAGPAEVIG
jgi:small conductance mechanosensitive channel